MAKLKGLGRGLDALLAVVDATDDRLQQLPISCIHTGKFQPRSHIHEDALDELVLSILAQGVLQPVLVREIALGEYELIAGERRWRAAQRAGLATIPAVIRIVSDEVALAMALIENIQRQDLNPIEAAQGMKRLIDEFGMTHETAAAAVGRSRSAVSNLLRLLTLPDSLQHMLHQGQLEMGHARALVGLPLIDQIALAQEAVQKSLSVREVERRVKQRTASSAELSRPTHSIDQNMTRVADEISDWLGTQVSIRHGSAGHGKITIEYGSLDELDALLTKLQQKPRG